MSYYYAKKSGIRTYGASESPEAALFPLRTEAFAFIARG